MFDDPNLLTHAGLAPLLAIAWRAKAMCLVAGMAAGADNIDGMDLLRGGAMKTVFGGVSAPRPPSDRSCARSLGETSASSTRRTAA